MTTPKDIQREIGNFNRVQEMERSGLLARVCIYGGLCWLCVELHSSKNHYPIGIVSPLWYKDYNLYDIRDKLKRISAELRSER